MEHDTLSADLSTTAAPALLDTSSLQVSLVIPTYNRCASLRMVLEGLARQTVPPEQFEVLVISDGATDDTVAMCQSLKTPYTLRIIEQTPNQGPAATRNRGVKEATAAIILFIDDDVVPEPTLIAEHLRIQAQDELAVVIGPLLAPPDVRLNSWTSWEEAMLQKQYRDMSAGKWEPTPRQFYTGNASVRREYILKAGGFDPTYRRAEDVELAERLWDLGLRFYFHPEAKGWHHARRSLRSWLNIPSAYGQADVAMYRSNREVPLHCMAEEFHGRQHLLQWVARACVGHAYRVHVMISALLAIARLADWTRQQKIAYATYSAIFNLRYWHSISEQIGTPAFWALVEWKRPDKDK